MYDQTELENYLINDLKKKGVEDTSLILKFSKDGVWTKNVQSNFRCIVVIKDFELGSFVSNLIEFLRVLPEDILCHWYKNFTKTIFLVGNPEKLRRRFPSIISHVSRDNEYLWTYPGDSKKHTELEYLLKRLETSYEVQECEITIGKRSNPFGQKYHLLFDVADFRLERYLVHLHHVISESYIQNNGFVENCITIHNKKCPIIFDRQEIIYRRISINEADASKLKLYGIVY